jgi:UDPglucose 6-dehydrogenase
MKEQFGIIGYGIVGTATNLSICDGAAVVHDIALDTKFEDLKDCTVVFICIPTEHKSDINKVFELSRKIKEQNGDCRIVIRSTLPVGTSARIQIEIGRKIIYLPEFLRERHWSEDCKHRPLVVGTQLFDVPAFLKEQGFYACSLEEAETLKMFNNNLSALKTVFANHFYDLCNKIGADYNTVLQMHELTKHDQSYLKVNQNLRGFGGKCLPKDLDFIINTFDTADLDQMLFTAMKEDNSQWPTTVRKS